MKNTKKELAKKIRDRKTGRKKAEKNRLSFLQS